MTAIAIDLDDIEDAVAARLDTLPDLDVGTAANAASAVQAVVYIEEVGYHGSMGRGIWGTGNQPLRVTVLLLVSTADMADALLTLREYRKYDGTNSIRACIEGQAGTAATLGGVVGDAWVEGSKFLQLETPDGTAPKFGCEFTVAVTPPQEN